METKSINVNNTSKDSFLKTQADCSVNQGGYTIYKPINKITWSDDKINLKCGNSFKTKNIKTLRGPSRGYPWNQYLYMYFINGAKAICDNEPLLGMKFSQVKDYQYKDLEKSSYSSTERNVSIQNNNFIDNEWLQNTQKVYSCPNNWFLSKIGGSTRYEGTLVYNNYDWTCGTFYNDYKNSDGAEFQWRYYKEAEDIYIQVLTNAMITTMFNDDSLQDFAGSTIYFDIRYNITKNVVSVMYKIEYDGDDSPYVDGSTYVDGTTYCHIENKSNSIEINFPLTELSIIQIIFTRGDFTIFDDTTSELNKLPLCFSKMTIVQDTNLPKIFKIMYDTSSDSGATCNNEKQYVKKYTEGTPIGSHANCFKLGHTATYFVDKYTGNVIDTNYIVDGDMTLVPHFEANRYNIKFINNNDGLVCSGKTQITASLNEPLSDIPECSGTGMVFTGWFDNDNRKATSDTRVVGDMIFYTNVEYPTFKLIYVTDSDVVCSDCINYKLLKAYEEIGKLPEPYLEGKEFVGWYYDNAFTLPVKETDKIVKDTFIYPYFEKSKIKVFFIIPNGATINPNIKYKEIISGKTINPLPTCTKTGATFKGWYKITETNLGQKCNVLTPFTNETVLTAVFDVNGTNVYKTYQEALNMGDLDTTYTTSSSSSTTGVLTSSSSGVSTGSLTSVNSSSTSTTSSSISSTGVLTSSSTGVLTSSSTGVSNSISSSTNGLTSGSISSTGVLTSSSTGSLTSGSISSSGVNTSSSTNGLTSSSTSSSGVNTSSSTSSSTGSSTSVSTSGLTSGSTIKYCAEDDIWPTTNINKTVEIGCPINYIGKQSRTCDSNGEWKDVNSSGCIMQCPADGDWDATEVNKTAEITSGDCILTRECGSDGKWGDVQTDCGNSKVMPIILLIIGVISILIGFFIKQYIIIGIGIIVAVIGCYLFFASDKE